MDFKPYTEVVLPPERGTGIHKKKLAGAPLSPAIAPPRRYRRRGEEETAASQGAASSGPKTYTVAGVPVERRSPDQERSRPTADEPDAGPPPAAAAELAADEEAVMVETTPAGESHHDGAGAGAAPAPKSAENAASKPVAAEVTPRDFVFAYAGCFLGHFRSTRRITDRTAVKKIACRLAEALPDFDIAKLQVFKPVPVHVDGVAVEDLDVDAFGWFEGTLEPTLQHSPS